MKKLLLPALCAVALLAACNKDSNNGITEPTPSILGKWQLDNYTIRYFRGGQPISTQVTTRDSMAACAQDDYWEYKADSSGTAYYGKLCSGETVTSEPFTWQLSGDVLIQDYGNNRQEGMTISNITANYYTALDTLYPTTNRPDTGTILQQYKRVQ